MKPIVSSLEALESRIAPAMVTLVIVNPTTATYTDVDGDHVTVKVSTGGLTAADFTGVAGAHGDQLQELDLSAASFDHANITFSVAKVAGGDGLANVGSINGGTNDLGSIVVKGDLGQIDAGSGSATVPAIKSLAVQSMGRLGVDTQAGAGDLTSLVKGALGSLKVATDVDGVFVDVYGATTATLGSIKIGGSLIGGSAATDTGEIYSQGAMGPVKIGGDIEGGSGTTSGFLASSGALASLTIGGSVIGGSGAYSAAVSFAGAIGAVKIGGDLAGGLGQDSASIQSGADLGPVSIGGSLLGSLGAASAELSASGDMGLVKIGHDVVGGAGEFSGLISSVGTMAGVSIGGSLIGGSAAEGSGMQSGAILSKGDLGPVKIAHNLTGGSISGAASLSASGFIESITGRIASVAIGGSIVSGSNDSTGTLADDASIRAHNDLGSLTVGGSLIGNATASGVSPVVITARGQAVQGATTDLAIGKITIRGRVEYANILAGYDTDLTALNGDAQIGAVKVGGDWAASNLVAGALNRPSSNTEFGNTGDTYIGAGNTTILSKIASITIAGELFGTPASVNASDQFGFVAEQFGPVKIAGIAVPLTTASSHAPIPLGETSDTDLHEIPSTF